MGCADLHSHSTASDGALAPAALVALARSLGVTTLALTDHDTMDGVPEAVAAGRDAGVTVIPGVELSARVQSGSMHILGYFGDPQPAGLVERLRRFRELRVERAQEMVERLARLGAPVAWDDVERRAAGAIGRPHVAEALVAAGHAADRHDAFARYLADDGPAYVPSSSISPQQALEILAAGGGAPVLAHPFSLGLEGEALRGAVADLAQMGLRGIEVHRPDHGAIERAALLEIAQALDLVPTGGSDFHRPDGPVALGDTGSQPVPEETVSALRALR